MKVALDRWGEVLIRRVGEKKGVFDKIKSFSIEQTETNYSIDEYRELLKIATSLSEKINFKTLKSKLLSIGKNKK